MRVRLYQLLCAMYALACYRDFPGPIAVVGCHVCAVLAALGTAASDGDL